MELNGISSEKIYFGQELFDIKANSLPQVPDKMSFVVNNNFVKKEKIRFKEGVVCEDGIFSLNIYMKAKRVRQLRESCFVYYNNIDSIGHNYDKTYEFVCCFLKFVYFLRTGKNRWE